MAGRYGLPEEVVFCKKCTISNQRPNTSVEFKNKSSSLKTFINFNKDGVCDACIYADEKKKLIGKIGKKSY